MRLIPAGTPKGDPDLAERQSRSGLLPPLAKATIELALSLDPCMRVYLDALPELLQAKAKWVIIAGGQVVGTGSSIRDAQANMRSKNKVSTCGELPSPHLLRPVDPYDLVLYFHHYQPSSKSPP